MYEYIKGQIKELKPTYVVLDVQGIGYFIDISLNTYTQLDKSGEGFVFIHHIVREDAQKLYGFINKKERDVFRHLISVSGIGANTARMMLSSITPADIEKSIIEGNVAVLKGIKGIGAKTAQRVIVDLRDKIGKIDESSDIFVEENNTIKNEALSALIMLGFKKSTIEKLLDKMLKSGEYQSVEHLVKEALKQL